MHWEREYHEWILYAAPGKGKKLAIVNGLQILIYDSKSKKWRKHTLTEEEEVKATWDDLMRWAETRVRKSLGLKVVN